MIAQQMLSHCSILSLHDDGPGLTCEKQINESKGAIALLSINAPS